VSPPLSHGAAPLDSETLATLQAEIAKRGMSTDRLRKRLVPPVSGATFWRAIHGQKVSAPVQRACADMARTIREQGHSRVATVMPEVTYDWDPDPEAA
jgi:hypothetical protein